MTKNPMDDTVTDYASISSQYGYVTENGVTTNLVSSVNNTVSGAVGTSTVNYSYTYDSNGRISGITAASAIAGMNGASQYIYDEAGQLIKEIKGSDYIEYAYDSKGNISTRKTYSGGMLVDTDTFAYGSDSWEDRLTGYNDKTVTYDSIGNPTSYLGATLTWRGRELESYTNGDIQISYSYDVDGMRYRKVVKTDGVETARYDYVYSEGSLILITYTADGVSDTARFIYDSYGEPRGFILNNTAAYLYIKNAQGDITGIVNENGEVILTYAYTAWGEITYSATSMQNMLLAATLSNVNPFTYRGYCYDYDIGMYYLQSRYYDPEIGRFINADSTDYLGATGTLLSYNLFAYCENDPVNGIDPSGCYKDYAFTILPSHSAANIIYAISKDIEATGKTGLKAKIVYSNFSTKKTYKYNANISYKMSGTAIYVKYSKFRFGDGSVVPNFYSTTYYYKKTYAEWLFYVAKRHTTIFDKIEEKAIALLDMSDYAWASFTNDLGGAISLQGILSSIPEWLTVYDVLSVITSLLNKWLDKPSKYIMEILNRRPNLEKSNRKIAIMWNINNYNYGFHNNGTGFRKGWYLSKKYNAWNL